MRRFLPGIPLWLLLVAGGGARVYVLWRSAVSVTDPLARTRAAALALAVAGLVAWGAYILDTAPTIVRYSSRPLPLGDWMRLGWCVASSALFLALPLALPHLLLQESPSHTALRVASLVGGAVVVISLGMVVVFGMFSLFAQSMRQLLMALVLVWSPLGLLALVGGTLSAAAARVTP